MEWNLFGLKLGGRNKSLATVQSKDVRKSFVLPQDEDAIPVEAVGGAYGMYLDTDGTTRSDSELVFRYREMAAHPEVENAISDIVGEAIACDDNLQPVKINLDQLKFKVPVKTRITEEFEEVLRLLKFQTKGYDQFRRWYVDSRIIYHKIVDTTNPEKGLVELRWIDPVNIQKIKQFNKEMNPEGQTIITSIDEYYVYSKDGFKSSSANQQGLKISPDAIAYVSSGLLDSRNKRTVGYLHKAIKPLNQLRMMEDAVVIYRISRAPERRVFYIDVGSLPKNKAEQYVRDLMNRFKNKLTYDSATGEVRDDRRHMSMLEDFWLPRREGGKGTEITTLPGGCLAMDTKVSLLDGRELTIKQIEEEMKQGKQLWTYSCHPTTGEIAPGLITWAGVTQESAEVMKLTLDNGQEIICTPDHKFPQYGTGFVRADELQINSSMIPLYRKNEKLNKTCKYDYEQIFDNSTKTWKFTHRMVAKTLKNVFVHDFVFSDLFALENKNVIHHKNFNRFDNCPENLCFMSWNDHCALHCKFGFTEEIRKLGTIASAKRMKLMKETQPEEYAKYCNSLSERWTNWWGSLDTDERNLMSQKISTGQKNYWNNLPPDIKEYRGSVGAFHCRKGVATLQYKMQNDPEYYANICEIRRNSWTEESKNKVAKRMKIRNAIDWNDPFKGKARRINHKQIQKIVIDNEILTAIIDKISGKTTHQVTIHDVVNYLNSTEIYRNRFIELNKNKKVPNWNISIGFTSTILQRCIKDWGFKSWKDLRIKHSNHNHRIVKIERLPDRIQVGTLTIDNDEKIHNYHTFALSCGIFTKNSNLSQLDDVIYFQKKLYQSLNVPLSRLGASENKSFSIGKSTEIQRDEIKFAKFITRLRNKFSELFLDLLKTQLILKNIIVPEDWDEMVPYIYFNYNKDSYFAELKEKEILREQLDGMAAIEPYIGRYYSKNWVRKHVLRMTDTDIEEMQKEMEEEAAEEAEQKALEMQQNGMMGQQDPNAPPGIQPSPLNPPPQQQPFPQQQSQQPFQRNRFQKKKPLNNQTQEQPVDTNSPPQ